MPAVHAPAPDGDPETASDASLPTRIPDFRALFEALPGLCLVMDHHLRIVALSDLYARALGIRREDVVGRGVAELYSENFVQTETGAVQNFLNSLQRVLAERTAHLMPVQRHDLRRSAADGGGSEVRYWGAHNSPVLAADGSVAWIIHCLENVTAKVTGCNGAGGHDTPPFVDVRATLQTLLRKALESKAEADQARLELNLLNLRLRALVNSLPLGIAFSDDTTNRRITGNPALLAMFEASPGDNISPSAEESLAAGRKVRYFKNGREALPGELPLQRAVATNVVIEPEVFEVVLPSGRRWLAECSGAPVRDEQGAVVAGLVIVRDVTQQRKDAEHIRLLGTCVAQLDDAVLITEASPNEPGPRIVYVNDAFTKHTGYTRAEALGRSPRFLQGPKTDRAELDRIRVALQEQRAIIAELINYRKNGEEFSLELRINPVVDADGHCTHFVAVQRDVTARKRQEELLRRREFQLHSFVQHAPAALAMFDRQMNYVAASQNWIDDFIPAREEFIGRSHYEVSHAMPERWKEIHQRTLRGETVNCDEESLTMPDGGTFWVQWSCSPWFDDDGQVGGIIILTKNISAQKAAESARRRSEDRLRFALESLRFGTFEIDCITGAEQWSPIEYQLLGLKPGEFPAHSETLFRLIHPDDLGRVRSEFAAALASGLLNSEFRIVRPDGLERWLAARGSLSGDLGPNGKPISFFGFMADTSDSKSVALALDQSRLQMEGILRSAMDAIISIDPDQRILLFNRAAEELFGCPERDALGTSVERFIPAMFRARHSDHIRRFGESSSAGRRMHYLDTVRGLRADGSEVPLEGSISQFDVAGRKIYTVILRDITERRILEREVLEIGAHEQRRIGQDLHDDVCQWLSGAEFLSVALAKNLAVTTPTLAGRAEELASIVRQALARTRALAHGLVPSVIESGGLHGVLAELVAVTAATFRIRCQFDAAPTVIPPIGRPALELYHIAQEALNNAVRHGGADTVVIRLDQVGDRLVMTVRDNGRGLPPAGTMRKGMGLRTMRYRARLIAGTLELRPAPGGGTEVICSLPSAPTSADITGDNRNPTPLVPSESFSHGNPTQGPQDPPHSFQPS